MASDSTLQPSSNSSQRRGVEWLRDKQVQSWILTIGLCAVIMLSYWNTLANIAATWSSAQYSHGYLVPLFAIVLLWLRREPFTDFPTWHRWVGAGLIAIAVTARILATKYVMFTIDNLSIIPCLMGAFVLVGGLRTLRWAGPPLAFLVFMLPLPGFAVNKILRPLQTLATVCSVYAVQTLGVDAYRAGNRIILESMEMGVVDQCSGLRMTTIFFALAAAIAMVATTRPWWERMIILASAIPIALTVNVIRITITGLLYNMHVTGIAKQISHDWAGYIMMPLALGFLFLELQILSNLVVEATSEQMRPAEFGVRNESGPSVARSP